MVTKDTVMPCKAHGMRVAAHNGAWLICLLLPHTHPSPSTFHPGLVGCIQLFEYKHRGVRRKGVGTSGWVLGRAGRGCSAKHFTDKLLK